MEITDLMDTDFVETAGRFSLNPSQITDIKYFENKIRNSLKEAVSPAIQTMALLMGSIIVSSVFSMLADTVVGEGLKKTFSFCSPAVNIYHLITL